MSELGKLAANDLAAGQEGNGGICGIKAMGDRLRKCAVVDPFLEQVTSAPALGNQDRTRPEETAAAEAFLEQYMHIIIVIIDNTYPHSM